MTAPRPSPAGRLRAVIEQLADATGADRGDLLAVGLSALAKLQQQLAETQASLRIADKVVVRHRALLQVATEEVETARRWARSLWDDGPASEGPIIYGPPEVAPAWLTADGPRHTARRPRRPLVDLDPADTARALRMAALERVLADLQEEWGPLTDEELTAAVQDVRVRGQQP
ncbi:hypothetical protein SAMN05660690_4094 [Geodermatophilus telluris]|uniref:Uncharacterized protein n=1 Tax=Geodermatophilus telluris TaxID=1190417 RepID=A0A1G6U7K3_9ACTN|nr:hypothetical protein [Geodermatophilus telluris]SDD37184.1 hypothetical protein SAMN05660690_4094 [Geodermatophilus telluris]